VRWEISARHINLSFVLPVYKKYQSWWKFDEVLAKTILQFFWGHGVYYMIASNAGLFVPRSIRITHDSYHGLASDGPASEYYFYCNLFITSQSDLRPRAASRWGLPHISSYYCNSEHEVSDDNCCVFRFPREYITLL